MLRRGGQLCEVEDMAARLKQREDKAGDDQIGGRSPGLETGA